jgi:TolB-like protein/Flp pilus assembly protein TadD
MVALVVGAAWHLGPVDAPTPVKTLAVLPFSDLSPTEQNQAFADGVVEDVLTNLGQIGDLRVTGRTSVLPYRDTEKPLPEIADELGVSYLLEGSIRRADNRVRITARLVEATEGMALWRSRYDRQLEDIFAVQTDIAKAIANALETELAPEVERRIERAPTENLAAYQLFLRGREYVGRGTKADNETGIDLLRRALDRDPDFALARAALAQGYARDAWALGGNAQWADSAIAEAERAVALAPDLAEAHSALGRARMAAGRFSKATASFERAIDLNPNDWGAVNDLAIVYLQTGHLAPAIQQWTRVLQGNPAFAYGLRFNLALAYRVLGLLDRAEQANRSALALKPEHVLATVNQAHVDLFQRDTAAVRDAAERLVSDHGTNPYALQSAGWLYIFIGDPEQARAPLERAYALSPTASGEGYVRVRLGYVLWQAGDRERARQLFEEFDRFASEQLDKGNEYAMLPYSRAAAHAVRGETEPALQWLARAVEAGWPYELTTVHDPLLAPLQDDERFRVLVKRMHERNEAMRRQLAQAEEQKRAGRLPTLRQ